MKLKIDQNELVTALERCSAAATDKGSHAHTGKVLLQAFTEDADATLQAFATDLRVQVDVAAPAETVEVEGSVAVDCSRLLSMARAMPEGSVDLKVTTEKQNGTSRLLVTGKGRRRYHVPLVDSHEFPSASEPSNGAKRIELSGERLRHAVQRVQFSINTERANINGVMIESVGEQLWAVGLGPYSMAVWCQDLSQPAGDWSALLPGPMLKLALSLAEAHKTVDLVLEDPVVYMEAGSTLVGCMLPREPYLPWRQALQVEREAVCRVPRLALLEAIRGIMVAKTSVSSVLQIELRNDALELQLVGDENDANDVVPVSVESSAPVSFSVLVNPNYLNDAVKSAEEDFMLGRAQNQLILMTTDGFFGMVNPINPAAFSGAKR